MVFLHFAGWEIINIALEYTATSWMRFPRWLLAVVCVNLMTHPAFMVVLGVFGRSRTTIAACEIAIFAVEALALSAIYGFPRWRRLAVASLVMNLSSFMTGVLIML